MSLTENDKVMVYGNKAERLPTLAELSEYFNSNTSGNSGNAATASKLETARDITFSGAATGTGSFDGSQAVNIELTLEAVLANNVWVDGDNETFTLQAIINDLTARIQALENAGTP